MSVMRSTLIGGLNDNVVTNLKRKQSRVSNLETGRCFYRDTPGVPVEGFHQPWKLAELAYGSAFPEQWGVAERDADFFDLKGEVELLLAPEVARFEKANHPALHPGRSARVILAGKDIGFVGELHPQWLQKYDLPLAAVVFELELDAVKQSRLPKYAEVSRQPPAVRDLAIVVDQKLELERLLGGMAANRPAIVQDIRLFDVYAGKAVSYTHLDLYKRQIMGGADSGITLDTTEMFLESAFFAPKAIAGRARRYGFVSDASHRFERGVDFGGTRHALERATRLILEICGGQAGPLCEAEAALPQRPAVRLRPSRVSKVLGVSFSAEQIGEHIARLDFVFTREGDDFIVTPPSYRCLLYTSRCV